MPSTEPTKKAAPKKAPKTIKPSKRKPPEWTVRVHRVTVKNVGGRAEQVATESAADSFKLPARLDNEQARRDAKVRLKKTGARLRSLSFGAPEEKREILVYITEG